MEGRRFDELGIKLSKPVLQTLEDLNFRNPTRVQEECIPLLLKYKDVAAEAVTGSGKTLAFIIPIVELILRRSDPLKKYDIGALVISPTRELATQTHDVLVQFLSNLQHLTSLLIVGGKSINEDVRKLTTNGANIIVATPGRLEELLTKRSDCINLRKCFKELEILVLDEADKLLDFGFEKQLMTILRYLPTQRRTGLFSATLTRQLTALVKTGLRNPVFVTIKDNFTVPSGSCSTEDGAISTPSSLTNYYKISETDEKMTCLISFISQEGNHLKYIVFMSACACVDYFSTVIKVMLPDIQLFSLHGKMKDRRYKIFDGFKDVKSGILVCTDVMARGVDIPEVHWVIQYDPPSSASAFVHRAGRTARIGKIGKSLVILMPNEDAYVNFILRNQKVVLNELQDVNLVVKKEDVVGQMRQLQINNRKIFDKANRAFVSFVQSYSKHECNLILRVKDLDLGKLAMGFGLLKLPKMPELKDKNFSDFEEVDIDINDIKYLNEKQEAARLRKLEKYRDTGVWPSAKQKRRMKQTVSWFKTKQHKLEKQERKKAKKQKSAAKASEGKIKKKRKKKQKFTEEEMEELSKDIALIKKFKKKKITIEQFDSEFGVNES